MSFLDKIKEAFDGEPQESGEHDAPEHRVEDGHLKGWSAHDLTEDELVDDEWIRRNTREVQ